MSPPEPASARGAATSDFELAKRKSTFQLLFKAARLVNEAALARINRGRSSFALRPSHTNLLPHIEWTGTRVGDLAQRIGVSKQAISQLVDDLESAGVVERVADPEDGRARLVRFTRQGERSLFEGLAVLTELEAELAGKVGRTTLRNLHRDLTRILGVLEVGSSR
jgi:DNA-binding MarR family transcriptional regulator